jgi:ribosomal protein S18 acetylase RimI-like enzyme
MEIDLREIPARAPRLAAGYQLISWDDALLEAHADAKYRSFCTELDANVFPCLGERDGCLRLMTEITRRVNFLPGATWLIRCSSVDGTLENCGTIQGVSDRNTFGAIQNLGITPAHRGQGIGSRLLYEALRGFSRAGLPRAYLEVTAQNEGALRLYHRFGFCITKTVYKAAEVAYA